MSNEQSQDPTEETGREETADSGESTGGAVDFAQLTPELKVAALTERLEAAEAEADKYRSEMQYKEAELQTERRRAAEQRAAAAKYRDEDLLLDLLPAIEGLELALNADVSDQWGEGVKLVVREMKRRLEMRGVSLIDSAAGAPFDPTEHEALAYQESDVQPPEHIVQLVRPGYRLHDRLLRPAQVIVARDPLS
ncbi:MAG: nucleotide exchange factor GrpE [Chloroflexi bacterium]|nr:nucleotide exchange factor GrpE [Chloroflexota bacterium]MYE39351.1 nucleotide exchange factor GrpE [Chloroflexota bacterium]